MRRRRPRVKRPDASVLNRRLTARNGAVLGCYNVLVSVPTASKHGGLSRRASDSAV